MTRIGTRLAIAILALAIAGPGTSSADTAYSLTLSPPPAATAGQPFVVKASGTDPIDQGALYLEVDEIAANVASTCPTAYLDGAQLATSTGGALVALDLRETPDGSGSFSAPIGFTPKAAGTLLFCAYTDDGATDTLAAASLTITVTAPGATQPTGATPSAPTGSKGPASAYARALAKCSKLTGKSRTSCVKRAKLARALAHCSTLKNGLERKHCRAAAHRRYHT